VRLDPRPVVLRRPEAAGRAVGTTVPQAATPASSQAPAPPVPPEKLPGFPEGFRAGVAHGEAAQRARELQTLEASQRMAFEQGREEGRLQGIAEGREAGRAAVEREARATGEATAARLEKLDRLLAALPGEIGRRLENAEDDMIALCHAAVCRILGEELLTPEGIAQHVRQAIREGGPSAFGGGHGQLAIHVHPRDLAALESDPALAAWLRQHATSGAVQWAADERVRLGGCIIRSVEGSLDARLETQLAALGRLLEEKRASAAGPTDAAVPTETRSGGPA
jgi:flagellar assembly protein FliH